MKTIPRESAIVEQILKYLNSLPGCRVLKRHADGYGRRGLADIYGSYSGIYGFAYVTSCHIEIEIKRPGQKPTDLQLAELRKWQEVGAIAFWATSVAEVKEKLEGRNSHG